MMRGAQSDFLRGTIRLVQFWAVFVAAFACCDVLLPWMHFFEGVRTATEAAGLWNGRDGAAAAELVSRPGFIGTLAWSIAAGGIALLVAFLVNHVLVARLSLNSARKVLQRYADRASIAAAYETEVLPKLQDHSLVGHAWKEFDETLMRDQPDLIRNTVRPQAFINYSVIRERLPGLKMLGSISGYFVGIGLLLTFIGIVIALNTAASSVGSSNAQEMMSAMNNLLRIASLKFTTSIAGLGTSIVFAVFAKLFVMWIEGGIAEFCNAVEVKLLYTAPQSITAQMHEVAKEQRDQLKELNSERYFTRMAEAIESSMARAVTPMTVQIGSAVDELKKSSMSTGTDMARQISESLRGSAGTEMQALGQTLQDIQASLEKTHSAVQGSGADFAKSLESTADNLSRLIVDAGAKLESSAEQGRASLVDVVAMLKDTLDAANGKIAAQLDGAAMGASDRLEGAMGAIMARLEGQVSEFIKGLDGFAATSSAHLGEVQAASKQAQSDAVASVAAASSEAAQALRDGLADAMAKIAEEVDKFRTALHAAEGALGRQANAIGDATSQTRSVADAFATTAKDVRSASAPLLEAGTRIAGASSEIAASVGKAVTGLDAANEASGKLADSLGEKIEQLAEIWEDFRDRFERVDEDLAKAVDTLQSTNAGQAERLATYAKEVDQEMAKVVNKLSAFVGEFSESTDSLAESAERLANSLAPRAAE